MAPAMDFQGGCLVYVYGVSCRRCGMEDELRTALKQNDIGRVQQLVSAGRVPQLTADALPEGATCLHVSALLGYVECVSCLLRVSGLLLQRDASGWPALLHAVEAGHMATARLLLQRDTAAATVRDSCQQTALHVAARCGSAQMTQLLLGHGLEVDAVDAHDMTPLLCAVEASHAGVARCLYAAGACFGARAASGKTVLHLAAEHGNERLLRWLLRIGCSGATTDARLRTPLMLCVQRRRVPPPLLLRLIARLVDAGTPLNTRDARGNTALLLAVGNAVAVGWRHVALLLNAGADADIANRDGLTPLWQAVCVGMQERVQVVRVLLQHNCRLDTACRGSLLFTSGLDKVYCYESCLSPLEVALNCGHYQLARILVLAGCRVQAHMHYDSALAQLQWYRDLVCNPSSLQHKCRLVIRNRLGRAVQANTRRLPLPDSMKCYLLLQDLF